MASHIPWPSTLQLRQEAQSDRWFAHPDHDIPSHQAHHFQRPSRVVSLRYVSWTLCDAPSLCRIHHVVLKQSRVAHVWSDEERTAQKLRHFSRAEMACSVVFGMSITLERLQITWPVA